MSELPDAPFATDLPNAPFVQPDMTKVARHFAQARTAKTFGEYLDAGWQQSVTGLVASGKAPEVALDAETPWYGRLAAGAAGLAGDAPAMLAGGLATTVVTGGRGGPIAAGAGAFAAPMAIRAGLMDAYTKGEVNNASEFLSRVMNVAWEGFKGGVTGAATVATGGAAKALTAAAPMAAQVLVPTAAEIVTMTTVGKALEGNLPEWSDFLDASVLIFGVKGAVSGAGKLATIYEKNGRLPAQVVADVRSDPTIAAEIKTAGDQLPAAYKPEAEAEMLKAALPTPVQAAEILANPRGTITDGKEPNHINYRYNESPEDILALRAKIAETMKSEIEAARGKESWDATQEKAVGVITDRLAAMSDDQKAALKTLSFEDLAAQSMAVEAMAQRAAFDTRAAAAEIARKGDSATPDDFSNLIAAIEQSALLHQIDQGNGAEIARALNSRKASRQRGELAEAMSDTLAKYGQDPHVMARMVLGLHTTAELTKFAKDAAKATTWEKILEAWKAGLLSGPVTHMRNVLGNTSFLATRPVIDATASAIGFLRGSPADRVTAIEPIARIIGNLQGTIDGAKYAWSMMKTGEDMGKSEQYKTAIGGKVGEVIRLPFRALSAADAFFKTMNERGEAYSLAVRQATQDGLNPTSREFQTKVVELVENPSKEISAAIEKAGLRFTFNMPLGEKGQALQGLVRKAHLEWAMPFVRTPGNILKETVRLTPFSPLVGEWRAAIKEGGAARDKAIAELATGTAFMGGIFMAAAAGNISGAGDPDPGKRRVAQAAGWQPYSIKVGDTWYNYQGIGPVTTLIGLAADMAMVWDRLDDDESDKIPKILAVAFANAVTSQTALMGMTSIVNVTSDPTRYAPRFFQGLVGTVVPAIIAQPTSMADPYVREVNSMLDAIKARIPGEREQLLAKRDLFGEQIKTKERLGGVSPITTTTESDDKVRTEAERLGLSAAAAPKKVHLGHNTGKVGDVKLTPEQQDKFEEVSGALAKHYLDPIVNAPSWDAKPDIIKKRLYAKVFLQAHKAGANAALPPDVRGAAVQEITARMQEELRPE